MSKTVTFDKAIDLLYDNDHKKISKIKSYTIKEYEEIPICRFFKIPDLDATVKVIYNELPDIDCNLNVDELIAKILLSKNNLIPKESYVLKLAIENIYIDANKLKMMPGRIYESI